MNRQSYLDVTIQVERGTVDYAATCDLPDTQTLRGYTRDDAVNHIKRAILKALATRDEIPDVVRFRIARGRAAW